MLQKTVFVVLLSLLSQPYANAGNVSTPPVLESTLTALSQSPTGAPVWLPADEVSSADRIRYKLEMVSHAEYKLADLKAAIPVPENATYVADTAHPRPSLASLDGVHFKPVPLVRTVRQADGKVVRELIPQSDYRALAWQIAELGPGEAKNLSIEVVID